MFNTVGKYIRRSPYQAIVASLIMSFTFYMISIFALQMYASIRVINFFESRPQLSVFFRDEATTEEIQQMKNQFEATGKTSSVTYISKDEAYKIYKQTNQKDPILLDLVSAEVLPASLEVKSYVLSDLTDLAKIAKSSPLVEEVVYQQDVVDTLLTWTDALKKAGLFQVVILLIESILVITTIISFKIVVKREEIETMKLLGATNSFIRIPFILEGMIYGIIGSVIGWCAMVAVVLPIQPTLESFLKGINVFPLNPVVLFAILTSEMVLAAILGAFSSYVAVKRYLK